MPLIRIRDVGGDSTENFYSGPFEEEFIVRKGDILIGMDGDFHAAIWKGSDGLLNQRVCRLIPFTGLYSKDFLFLALQPYLNAINAETSSVTVKHLSSRTVADLPIPLPPLAEQKRIVAKIEELFSELEAGEESLRVARRQLGVYRQSLLKQAFEGKLTAQWRTQNPDKLESPAQLLARIQSAFDARSGAKAKKSVPLVPFPADELLGSHSLPPEWLVVAYGDLCSIVRNGVSAKPSGETGHKIARISAVRPMAFDYDDFRFLDCDDEMASDYTLAQGDLVFTRYNGARRFVGVCAQFKGHEPRLYPDKLIRTRPDRPQLDPRYLEIALNCGLSRAWLETKIRTTAGQSGVSGGDVKAMPVPLCSLPEQHEIVRLLDQQFEVIDQNEREIDAALKRSEALRQSILKEAFTGRLVPQNPSDEPASHLLARLPAERFPHKL
jgi:type I restriction enzyme, S subunit